MSAIVGCYLVVLAQLASAATLLSNIGQTPVGSLAIANDSWRAERFFTGTNSGGYSLNSIQLQFGTPVGVPSGISLGIYDYNYDGNSTTPGNLLHSLTGADPSGNGVSTFQSSGLVLKPYSTYFIVATATTPLTAGSFQWDITSWVDRAHVFDFGAGGLLYHSSDGQSWTISRPNNFVFSVNATVVPEPASLALCLCGGIIAVHRFIRRRALQ